jgi:hypothetical protein
MCLDKFIWKSNNIYDTKYVYYKLYFMVNLTIPMFGIINIFLDNTHTERERSNHADGAFYYTSHHVIFAS